MLEPQIWHRLKSCSEPEQLVLFVLLRQPTFWTVLKVIKGEGGALDDCLEAVLRFVALRRMVSAMDTHGQAVDGASP